MRKWRGKFVWFGVIGLALVSLAASAGDIHWTLDLFSHFRPQLVALSFLWFFVALARHRPVAVVGCAILLALNAAPIVPYVVPQTQAETPDADALRLMIFNMHGRATQRAAFLDYVQAEQPDIILLTELPPSADWLSERLGADYRHRFDPAAGRPHDVMVLSRWPITASEVDRGVIGGQLPVAAFDLCRGERPEGACFRLVALHAISPFGWRFAAWQAEQFAIARQMAGAAPGGLVVLAGDLNSTPWSSRFRRLLADAGLRDAALGRGLTPTWLSRQPMVGLAIDHILASPAIATRRYEVGSDLGSDHLPVIADLAVPRRTAGATPSP